MHTLTKVFIVIWALLSVLVLALAIPIAVNQDTWKKRFEISDAAKITAEHEAQAAVNRSNSVQQQADKEREKLNSNITMIQSDLNEKLVALSTLRNQLASAQQNSDKSQTELSTLASTVQTQSQIIETQGTEIASRREESLRLQKRSIDLEDQLRDTLTTLDVSLDAQRILQEKIEQLNKRIEDLLAGPSEKGTRDDGPQKWIPAPDIEGRVLRVDDDSAGTRFAEINLGTRDGISENMRFIIARNGKFIANLIITTVDLNRAVGRLQLEQSELCNVNDRVIGISSY